MQLQARNTSVTGAACSHKNAVPKVPVAQRARVDPVRIVQVNSASAKAEGSSATDVVKKSNDFFTKNAANKPSGAKTSEGSSHSTQRQSLQMIYPRGSVAALVLGGGEADSRRLYPLTAKRTLPAIPLAGIYRLIDVPLSNLINSGVNKLFILTQYNSTSLNRYIQHTYDFQGGVPVGGEGFCEVVAATQGPDEQRWAEGPADTVRQWMNMFKGNATSNRNIEDIMVLPSDQVYKCDFIKVVDFHRQSGADLTIVCKPVAESDVEQLGVVRLSKEGRITRFHEKPKGDDKVAMSMDYDEVKDFMNDEDTEQLSIADPDHAGQHFIGSCGIYIFRAKALERLFKENKMARDFSKELIPAALKAGMKVMAYNLPGYWTDIGGSIADFYKFHMDLAADKVPFDFYEAANPFYSSPLNIPPTSTSNCKIKNALIGGGCIIEHSSITNSVVGSRTLIGSGCTIEDSIVMGADYYMHEKEFPRPVSAHYPGIGIGANTVIRKAIIDKNARIGQNVQLVNRDNVTESFDRVKKGIAIRDGIIVISKSSAVPEGTVV